MTQDKRRHVENQRQFFDTHCDFFRQPVPAPVEQRTGLIVSAARLGPQSRVLDVGTGTGVLFKHFLECGVPESQLVGCDLSENMLQEAKRRYPQATFKQGDFNEIDEAPGSFDAVFFNACFSNMFDQDKAMAVAVNLLRPNGLIIISQPLGNQCVEELQLKFPELSLTRMPEKARLLAWCETLDLQLAVLGNDNDFYLAVVRKITCQEAKDKTNIK